MVIGVIGGGASGMVAAITASQNPSNQVVLFERQGRVGRKLLATGNGRCNLSNLHALERGYHGENVAFSKYALERFSPRETVEWFRELGLFTVSEPSGRIYPYSDQANSVVDILRFALQRANVQVLTGFEVTKVKKTQNGFTLESGDQTYLCDKLIVACGGLAGTKLGGSMSGYKLLRSLGHKVTRLRPALVQLKSSWSGVTALKGVRTQCDATIFCNGVMKAHSAGELQFTDYGLSGPVIFEISRDACQEKGNWYCVLDFMPECSCDLLLDELCGRKTTGLCAEDLLTGILHNRLGRILVQAAGISLKEPISGLSCEELEAVCGMVKGLEVTLTEPLGMDCAQVTAGGICTDEFDPMTMESRLVSGLYACGEVLDVDGDCGGYNLQWAWSSGRLAGLMAGGKQR